MERTRQEQEGTYETPLCYTIPDEEKNKELWEAPPVKDFDPPYLRGGVEGRQMAKAIGTKRTPIGNLHTTSNPALYLPVVPSYVPLSPSQSTLLLLARLLLILYKGKESPHHATTALCRPGWVFLRPPT